MASLHTFPVSITNHAVLSETALLAVSSDGVQDGFTAYLEEQANASIVEASHIILIGLTAKRMPIIEQLLGQG